MLAFLSLDHKKLAFLPQILSSFGISEEYIILSVSKRRSYIFLAFLSENFK